MVYLIILVIVTLIGTTMATFTDLKTREVPDWLSYGLIAVGLVLNLLFSLVYWDYWFFVNSLAGFVLFLIVALIMFYAGQWGGGDSKVLMGLGALIGFDIRFIKFPFLISFLINVLLIGAIYGLVWSLTLVTRDWRRFYKEFRKQLHNAKIIKLRLYIIILVILSFLLFLIFRGTIFSSFFLGFLLISIITFYLWVFTKAVEKTCMIKIITPDKLTEGDWIFKDVRYKGKSICGPKDLGIEKKQIRELMKLYRQNKIKKIIIKEGIPFVPSFLVAYIISLFFGNLLFLLV